jgi:pyrroline-5-carboxylate reductase
MGSAILAGLVEDSGAGGSPVTSFTASVRSEASVEKLQTRFAKHGAKVQIVRGDLVSCAKSADVVIVATKPYALKAVLGVEGMGEAVRGKLVISVLAGISPELILDTLYGKDRSVDSTCRVVQATLNLAARIRQCTAVLNDAALTLPEEELAITQWVFEQIGEVRYLPASMMPVAAVMAAIPALASVALDGMLDGAVAQGVVRSQAREIAALNLIGLGKLLLDGDNTEQLREATASPRGVTIQALLELERGKARATFADAFITASEHARTMASIQD